MILFNDFKAHYASIQADVDAAVHRVLASGWYLLGEELQAFEACFGDHVGARHVVGVGCGTDAITLALMALNVGSGDEVITSNLTAFPTIVGIMQTGATPVVVDIEADTGLIDPAAIAPAITSRTRAVIPVHLYGQSCDLDPIVDISAAYDLKVVEDCAQSVGAPYRRRTIGTIGTLGCFSFYPTKNLGAFGDAGAVTTDDPNLFERLLQMRDCGQSRRYYHDFRGINSRMDELQAAILTAKLPHLEEWTARRRQISLEYRKRLPSSWLLAERDYGRSVCHLFAIKVPDRNEFIDRMGAGGVQTLIHYPVPINRQKAFPARKSLSFPVTEKFCANVVSLPLYPGLSDEQIDRISTTATAALT